MRMNVEEAHSSSKLALLVVSIPNLPMSPILSVPLIQLALTTKHLSSELLAFPKKI